MMVEQDPRNAFMRYALATEYKNAGDLERAVQEFAVLMEIDPNYSPAYFHGGQTLVKLGRMDEARATFRRGVEATLATGDQHAHAEMQGALDLLG